MRLCGSSDLFGLAGTLAVHERARSACKLDASVQVAIPALAKSAYDDRILAFAQSHLRDGEVRVRNAVADTLGALTAKHGTCIWHECKDDVMASIRDNYVRNLAYATHCPYTTPQS